MKIARKLTKPEMTELIAFIFNEELEDIGLCGWWELVWPDLTLLLKRLGAMRAVKRAAISVFDGCWMQGIGYVDWVMMVWWHPKQRDNEVKDIFIWLNGRLEIMPPEIKFWQRSLVQRRTGNKEPLPSEGDKMLIAK